MSTPPGAATSWDPGAPGVLALPSGLLVRGRGRRRRPPAAEPQWGLVLAAREPRADGPWPVRWVRWPDFRLPHDSADALEALREAQARCVTQRVEVSCGGGVGRTGTALAALVLLDAPGLEPDAAVEWVRRGYHPRAVETRGQRRWLGELRSTGRP